jgi:hypothetical protein
LRVGRRLRGFENIGVRKTSGTQRDENGGDYQKIHTEELYDLY